MKKRSRSAEAISVIIVSLVCSAAMRTINATAEAGPDRLEQFVESVEHMRAAQTGESVVAERATAEEAAGPLLSAIRDREAELSARENALATREAELAALQAHLDHKIQALETSRAALEESLSQVENAQGEDVGHLVEVYEGMKSKKAGAIFDQMTPDFAAGFLGAMRSDRAAGIMSNMSPEKVFAVSVILAGRNAEQPVAAN